MWHISGPMAAYSSPHFWPQQFYQHNQRRACALILASPASVILLVATASLGNVLGSVVNWYLGRGINHFTGKRWFPAHSRLSRATSWYGRYGRWTLLLSWVPVFGDPLTVVAGIMREPLLRFLLIVGIAKTGRYIVVALLALQWL